MGYLTDGERLSLSISDMSLHVVGLEDFEPQPRREVIEHEEFFVDRVRGNDIDSVYAFKEDSVVRRILQQIVSGELSFEAGAQQLAFDFSRLHVATSKEGAFFVFDLSANDGARIFCLIKYDYHEAIEQRDEEGKSVLRQIIHAFVKEKRAVQKCCLIRVVNGQVETAVAARDRVKPAPELSDYFYNYLGVIRTRTDVDLTRDVVEVVRQVLGDCKEHLPEGNIAVAFKRAKNALRERQNITYEAVVEIVVSVVADPNDEAASIAMQRSLNRRMASARLDGIDFSPSAEALGRPSQRYIRTAEGVTIQYTDGPGAPIVDRVQNEGGGETITVKTERVVEDRVIRDR
ncbi:nucleoid-associated protein [Luteibacter sp.]|jgi:hypothetical protein|uniref:nucleoid-associated protein n=1 Tax=Luteibacter sp. TaxID=1886636 RepID=UPI002F420934